MKILWWSNLVWSVVLGTEDIHKFGRKKCVFFVKKLNQKTFRNFFGAEILFSSNFFLADIFFCQNQKFDRESFWLKKNLGENFVGPKFFWAEIKFGSNIFLGKKWDLKKKLG